MYVSYKYIVVDRFKKVGIFIVIVLVDRIGKLCVEWKRCLCDDCFIVFWFFLINLYEFRYEYIIYIFLFYD